MSASRFSSTASAIRPASSLASSETRARRPASDCDINLSVALHHAEFLQPDARVAHMRAVAKMIFVAVPRADDMHVGLVELLAHEHAVLADDVDDLGHPHALAGGAALMRAQIAIGVILAGVPDDPDL